MYPISTIRSHFPILEERPYGKPLAYLDNGATTQKPKQVIDTLVDLYSHSNSNIHRGVHYLSGVMTERYEEARIEVQQFIHAALSQEIIFTAGTTAGINAVAFSFGERYVSAGDEILISAMEHHANIVPWQMLCDRKGAILRVIPMSDNGELDMEAYENLLTDKTRIVAVCHVSNTLGTVNPVKEIIGKAHKHDIPVLIDGAQSVQHFPIDVQHLDCDFFLFSGHKIYGPTGIGVLYGKKQWLDEMPPYQGGGDMVDCVTFERTTYNELPFKFEAGTANYLGAAALQTALEYVKSIGIEAIGQHEKALLQYATQKIGSIEGVKIYGNAAEKAGILSFLVGRSHPYDVGMILDKLGIAVRTGTHCTQPLMKRLGIDGTVRASFGLYNTFDEIDRLYEGILRAKRMLS